MGRGRQGLNLYAVAGLLLMSTLFATSIPVLPWNAPPAVVPFAAPDNGAPEQAVRAVPVQTVQAAPPPADTGAETDPVAAASENYGSVAARLAERGSAPRPVSRPRLPEVARLVPAARDGVTLYTLNVPYVNQMYDVPGFETTGNCACGPASLAMVLAYFGRLEPRPVEIALPYPHLSQFGWALVDGSHSFGDVTFERSVLGCQGEAYYGGLYGALMVDNQNRMTEWVRFSDTVTAHGLDVIHHDEGALNYEVVKTALVERGNPVVLTVRGLTGWGHLIVVTGYTDDGRLVVNDSFGSKWDGYPNYNGAGVLYTWADLGEVRHGWEIGGEGEGWQAEYRDAAGNVYVRTDRDINFDWGAAVPSTLLQAHDYTVRWSRVIDADGGPQTFSLDTDGAVRILVEGEVVAEAGGQGAATRHVVEIPLKRGPQLVEVEYRHAGGDRAVAKLARVKP